ncbi:hypothetical protein LCGC14_1779640, partial [marine sediment metagenome]
MTLDTLRINPNAFSHIADKEIDCFYYSFATLTTLGPGDIAPSNVYTKFLAILEAFVGQVYLATGSHYCFYGTI